MSTSQLASERAAPDTTNLVPLRPVNTPPTIGPAPMLTPPRQAAFCKALANHGNVRLACRAVQVSPQTAYRARRASAAFRACWDAALVIAREHVEQVLADRALNGVEEKVFYHGEEVATRRRYDSRLLLAHLARLDARAEAQECCNICDAPLLGEGQFDAALDALAQGEEGAQVPPREIAPGQCSMCSTLATDEGAQPPADTAPVEDEVEDEPEDGQGADLPPFERRLRAMEAALPPGAQALSGLSDSDWSQAEEHRLVAFEAGAAQWWLAGGEGADG
ncbi:hypothetical protein OZN62_00025 [Aurantiacibacter sp. MUD11]|uniref:hypothetical protein n=1 Tax=Aurantiacibacter sp. MUD11 TaxID=3003265 RepID=UPI0022AB1426|nr:hypothetical protein [Aurantiacibacter sp. MUD11]WAT18001.1 hypothetical protein OZN62_00025 [Aurantiacibacter sp. MUD11]